MFPSPRGPHADSPRKDGEGDHPSHVSASLFLFHSSCEPKKTTKSSKGRRRHLPLLLRGPPPRRRRRRRRRDAPQGGRHPDRHPQRPVRMRSLMALSFSLFLVSSVRFRIGMRFFLSERESAARESPESSNPSSKKATSKSDLRKTDLEQKNDLGIFFKTLASSASSGTRPRSRTRSCSRTTSCARACRASRTSSPSRGW